MALLCSACGAPLDPDAARRAVTCAFCGATSAPPPPVVVVGRLPAIGLSAAGREQAARLPCPRCADFLSEMRSGESALQTCRSCNGVWLDAATVARLRSARVEDIDRAAARIGARSLTGASPDRSAAIACPVCKSHLRREPIPGASEAIDVCDAHGTWFDGADASELQRFVAALESIRAGSAPAGEAPPAAGSFFSRLFGRRR
jgi:Zn-finger nucleic acid-binding protein